MSKREFLMLASDYATKHDISGWWMSEKLDGQRAFWDGEISRGLDAREVPYANVAKDGRFIERPVATGLWSRYGKVIHAPDWWLDTLPQGITLDMELWCGRGTHQAMRSIVGSLDKGKGWEIVKGWVIDSPSWYQVLTDGELTGTNWKGYLDRSMLGWVDGRTRQLGKKGVLSGCLFTTHGGFGQPDECFGRLKILHEMILKSGVSPYWQPMVQQKLSRDLIEAREQVAAKLHEVTAAGGEGLMLRSSTHPWIPKRVTWVLKVKKLSDAEGTVIGFTWGKQTDKMSRHLGRMGALILQLANGKRLELSGFTDEEREVKQADDNATRWVTIDLQVEDSSGTRIEKRTVPAESVPNEGKDASSAWVPAHFPIGSKVTYTYRELTVDGIPKEARYLRKRGVE